MDQMRKEEWKPLTDEQKTNVAEIKELGNKFYHGLTCLKPSREVSIAKTKIEEAVMWAVRHITAPKEGK